MEKDKALMELWHWCYRITKHYTSHKMTDNEWDTLSKCTNDNEQKFKELGLLDAYRHNVSSMIIAIEESQKGLKSDG